MQEIKQLEWQCTKEQGLLHVQLAVGMLTLSYEAKKEQAFHLCGLAGEIKSELTAYLERLAETSLYGCLQVASFGQVEKSTVANACQRLLSMYLPLQESLLWENEAYCLGLNDYGELTFAQVKQIKAMPNFNEALAQASQAYEQEKKQWGREGDAMSTKEIVIATKNKGKAAEFEKMFAPKGYTVKTLVDFPEIGEIAETGQSFTENALQKAETVSQLLNRPVLADDSGLCVDALGGQPGIYSARYAEDHNDAANNAKLLSELAGVPPLERTAHFHCTLAMVAPNKKPLIVEGEVEGLIAGIPQGENGFGYDPLFYLSELDCTMAQLSREQKNQLSHRAMALQKLAAVWDEWLEGQEK